MSLFLAALTVAGATNLLTNGSVFHPVRQWFRFKAEVQTNGTKKWFLWGFLAELVNCRYCLSHWVGGLAVLAIMGPSKEAAILYFPAVWLGNHSIMLYEFLTGLVRLQPVIAGYLNGHRA